MDIESGKVRITLRIEPDVYAMLVDVTNKTGRSLNSEITARVRYSFCTNSPVELTTTEKVFQRIIQEELDKRRGN